jgi:hypothetical protein
VTEDPVVYAVKIVAICVMLACVLVWVCAQPSRG